MSDDPSKSDEDAPATNSMAAFSSQLNNLTDALDMLYIKYNASGRNKFREKLPSIAKYIFGETLIKYDDDGFEDVEHRNQLEQEADDRRIDLKVTLLEIIDKSVNSGSLQFEYVGEIIDKHGAEVSQFLYADDIIERVRPGLLATIETVESKADDSVIKTETQPSLNQDETLEEPKLSEEEASILSNAVETKEVKSEPQADDVPPEIFTEKTSYKNLFNSVAIGK